MTPEWTVGTAFTYTDGKSTYDLGSADNKAYGFAAYGTRMAEKGQFVDLIAKYSRLSNDFTVNKDAMAGSFDNNAFSVSAEYGWHWNLNDVGFLEPQAELTYGKVLGETFTANNGVKVVQEDFESLIARLVFEGAFTSRIRRALCKHALRCYTTSRVKWNRPLARTLLVIPSRTTSVVRG